MQQKNRMPLYVGRNSHNFDDEERHQSHYIELGPLRETCWLTFGG